MARRRKRSGLWPAAALVAVVGGVAWVWHNINHWAILAVGLALVGVAVMAWVLALRRRQRTWLYEYDHATMPGRRYIGITNDPAKRHGQHAEQSWWFPSTTGQMRLVKCYRSRALALVAETEAIVAAALAGEPLANDRKVPQHIRQARIADHTARSWSNV